MIALRGKTFRCFELLCLTILMFGAIPAWAATNKLEQPNPVVWTEARGWVQHLNSLRVSPKDWSSALSRSHDASMPTDFSQCLSKESEESIAIDRCATLALQEAQSAILQKSSIDEKLIHKVDIFVALLKQSRKLTRWQAWLRLASVQALAGNFPAAKEMIDCARLAAHQEGFDSTWISERLEVYNRILSAVMNAKSEDEPALSDSGPLPVIDTQSNYILGRARKVIDSRKAISLQKPVERSVLDQYLSELTRSRWILSQDRIEVAALREQVLKSQLNLQSLRRIDSIVEQHGFKSPEWQAIVSLLSGVSAKVEFISRNDGLLLPFETWLISGEPLNKSLFIDDDTFLTSKHHILDEFIKRLGVLLREFPANTPVSEERLQIEALISRMDGMRSTVGAILNSVPALEKQQRSLLIKERLRTSDTTLRHLNARLAALDFFASHGSEGLNSVRDFSREIELLKAERRSIVSDYLSASANLMPLTMAQFESLRERILQTRKSLDDFKFLALSREKVGLDKGQSKQFFSESERFLVRLLSDSENYLANKTTIVRKVSSGFRQIFVNVGEVRAELAQFISSSSEMLRSKLSKTLVEVDVELFKRQRDIELQEEVVRTKLRRLVSDELKDARWRRDRLNDLRRIRSENLEWRAGQ